MTDTSTSHSAGASSLTITKDGSGQSDSSADSPLAARVHALIAQWRTVETAPKDGTAFRAFSVDLIDADFNPWGSVEAVFDGERFIGAVWNGQSDIWNTVFIEFTHWMPLPEPPPLEAALAAALAPKSEQAPPDGVYDAFGHHATCNMWVENDESFSLDKSRPCSCAAAALAPNAEQEMQRLTYLPSITDDTPDPTAPRKSAAALAPHPEKAE